MKNNIDLRLINQLVDQYRMTHMPRSDFVQIVTKKHGPEIGTALLNALLARDHHG